MIAPAVLGAQVEGSFKYYVDPVLGVDTNVGTRTAPLKSIVKAKELAKAAGPGQRIGLLAGALFRQASSTEFFGDTNFKTTRFGRYGLGANPIISGGTLTTGWTKPEEAGAEKLTNGGFESGTVGSAPTSWTVTSGTVTESEEQKTGGSRSAKFVNTGTSCRIQQTISCEGGKSYVFKLAHREATAARQMAVRVTIVSGAESGKFLHTNGSWSTAETPNLILPESLNAWATVEFPFTLPGSGAMNVEYFIETFEANMTCFADEVSVKPLSAGTGNVYQATLATEPTCLITQKEGATVFYGKAKKAASIAAMTEGTWFWASNKLYLYLPGAANPSGFTVDAAVVGQTIMLNEASVSEIDQTDFRLSPYHPIFARSRGQIFKRLNLRYCGFLSGKAGTIEVGKAGANTRVTLVTADYCDSTVVWINQAANVEVDHCTMTHIGALGTEADGIQGQDTGESPASFMYLHDNHISMEAAGEKSCINIGTMVTGGETPGVGSRIERNTLIGPASSSVLGLGQSQCMVRDNLITEGFHGIWIGQNHSQTEDTFFRNLITLCERGITFEGGTYSADRDCTKLLIANQTVYCKKRGLSTFDGTFKTLLSGRVVNCIFWCPESSSDPIIRVQSLKSGETLVFENCIIGPERSGKPLIEWLGTSYETLAAAAAANPTVFVNCLSSSSLTYPKFTEPASGDFSLKTGSPALGAGAAVSALGVAAAGNIGAK